MHYSLSPWQAVALAALGFSGVAAFGFAPDTTLETVVTHRVVRALAAPAPLVEDDDGGVFWREERVQRGDTIGSLLARAAVDDLDALTFMRVNASARPLYQLRPGRSVRVATDEEGRLIALRFITGSGDLLEIARQGDTFAARSAPPTMETRLTLRGGEIRSSLFNAADDLGLPDAVTLALSDVFAGYIDFYHDLRQGDRFSVLYEARYVDGEAVDVGRIVAAEFINHGTVHRAFLWQAPDGSEGYYAEDGTSTRKAFLLSPMEFSRITSGFTAARFNPVLQTMRAHRGIDFAAPTGTPIRATGEGVVMFAGEQNGYGNVIMIQHAGMYSTVYAHLSRFATETKTGAHVRQGDTIGYVGQTGWATGPHLHYEFRIAGEARNPLAIDLPTALPVVAEDRAAFISAIAPLVTELQVAHTSPGPRIAASE
ncbi:MAG TPA: peptidoglycan DD-metalloendopeptidase family protein [Casimicrobiaceae bacterium]